MEGARTLFRVLKENKTNEDKISRDIRTLFESGKNGEENFYTFFIIFILTIISNMRLMVIEIKHYQSKNS